MVQIMNISAKISTQRYILEDMSGTSSSSLFVILVYALTTSAHHRETYDYVIVGAGASGCVLANRLSANGTYQVLLLEAGGTPSELSDVPAYSQYMGFTDNVKEYLMERQDNFGLGIVDQRVSASVGQVLGGSTVVDDLIYSRGTSSDYDRWAAQGNPGWSYQEVLPYFKKVEDTKIRSLDPTQRGVGGPVGVSETPYRTQAVRAFIEAVRQSRLNYSDDYNNGRPFGVGYLQSTTRNGRRSSAFTAYLLPVLHRPNLHIYTRSVATQILFHEGNNTASGVAYEQGQAIHEAYARREVIVCAGAIGSPKLLMLSGIGPRAHLEKVGIETRVDLPVGEDMEDHVVFPALTFTVNDSIVPSFEDILHPRNHLAWMLRGTGRLSVPSLFYEANGYLKTDVSDPSDAAPDLAIVFASASFAVDNGANWRRGYRISDSAYQRMYRPLENRPAFSVLPILIRPASRGRLTLCSRHPRAAPRMLGNYLSDAANADARTLVAGIRLVQGVVASSPALRQYDARPVLTAAPGCEGAGPEDSDERWECQVRHLAVSDWHRVGTCAVGRVLCSRLRVRGAGRLRVADASAVPFALTGQATATAYMIGEKAADMVLEDAAREGRF